ncbi:Uncharacterised protein [Mycobacteroides abscessus subsp. abscessus]|nr:Uncharacterised protein [Mycobacteroides abscessus subsp. abscessus]
MQSSSFFSRAPARSRSSSAKWAPRLRLKVSRAVEYRFHSASSVLRSTPWMDFHSSRMARIRSPAAFHWVELVASSSASAASSSLREILAERASSRWARAAAACASADSTSAANRADRESTSPSTAAAGSVSARCSAAVLILRASPAPDPSRNSSSWTSVSRSSNLRPKCAYAASASPACHDPIWRSPALVISHTVPSSSTRPNLWGSTW